MQAQPNTETTQQTEQMMIESDQGTEQPQTSINLNYKGYERWFNRQVRQMIDSDNVQYKAKQTK